MTATGKRVGVIDVGSNSARCAVFSDGQTLVKRLITSRLGEGVFNGFLSDVAISRTVDAVEELLAVCHTFGAERVYLFATEAVRRAQNGNVFTSAVRKAVGLEVDVVDGKTEALLASLGALGEDDGCVVDLGGASTEIVVKQGGSITYAKSVGVGAVVLKDVCGTDRNKLTTYIAQKCGDFGQPPKSARAVAVGGTATSLAAARLGLKIYEPTLVHGAQLTADWLGTFADSIEGLPAERISKGLPIDGRRAEIIFGGALLLRAVIEVTGHSSFTVSECDNLEGYYRLLCERGEI